jgi:hypothetical protein
MRCKTWRSNNDKSLHLVCHEGAATFEALTSVLGRECEVDQLRLSYRSMLAQIQHL